MMMNDDHNMTERTSTNIHTNGAGPRARLYWRKLSSLFVTSALLLLALATLAGNTTPMCSPVEPEQEICLTSHDCEGNVHPECVGAWACVEASCEWQCGILPLGCYADEECPGNMVCDLDECLAPPGCENADGCAAVCYGQCVEPVVVDGCHKDDDCGAGQFCDLSNCPVYLNCMAADEMYCEEGDPSCLPPQCEGTCEDIEGECHADYDCGPDEQCVFQTACPLIDCDADTPDCVSECVTQGFCEPRDKGCESDNDCGPGERCELLEMCWTGLCGDEGDEDVKCGGCETYGECVPEPDVECNVDSDCEDGEVCVMYEGNCPGCNEGDEGPCDALWCPYVGVCEPEPQTACISDVDCGPGEMCVFDDYLNCLPYDCADGEDCLETNCLGAGHCEPIPSKDCYSNDDCGPGEECVYYETGCLPYECDEDEPCPTMPCVLTGVCEPVAQPGCLDDSDCPQGTVCELADCDCSPYDGWGEYCDCLGAGVCVPDVKPDLCVTNQDCPSGTHCNANEICILPDCSPSDPYCGYCHGTCEPNDPEEGCFSDYDCDSGEVCALEDGYDCCPPNAYCADYLPACEGTCVPAPELPCAFDSDCQQGEYCDQSSYASMPGCCVPEAYGNGCPMDYPLCPGVCLPLPEVAGCLSDADCDADEVCNLQMLVPGLYPTTIGCCPPNALCDASVPPCGGTCVPAPEPEGCFDDSECAPDEICELLTPVAGDDPATMGCCPPNAFCYAYLPACEGQCVPAPKPEEFCYSDNECGGDQHCSVSDGECLNDPTCPYCDVCTGVCVDDETPPPSPCRRTGCSGQLCLPFDMNTTCEWMPEYACYHFTECVQLDDGSCGWEPTEDFKDCLTLELAP